MADASEFDLWQEQYAASRLPEGPQDDVGHAANMPDTRDTHMDDLSNIFLFVLFFKLLVTH
jgi:hypothetical protein